MNGIDVWYVFDCIGVFVLFDFDIVGEVVGGEVDVGCSGELYVFDDE